MEASGHTKVTATIASSASLSGAVDLQQASSGLLQAGVLVGIELPASWTTANLTFQGSHDGVDYADVYDEFGIELTTVVGALSAARRVVLDPARFAGLRYIKVRSGTTGTPVSQGAARDIGLIVRPAL
jgi:hypothetical protein